MAMLVRATAVSRPSHQPKPALKPQLCSAPPLLLSPLPATFSLIALVSQPLAFSVEAKAFALPKEDIVSSLTKVEDTVELIGDVGSKAVGLSKDLIKVTTDTLSPVVDAALPLLKTASEEAVKIISPLLFDVSKQAKEALQSAGVDPSPVLSAAKTVTDAAQKTTLIIEGAKPIASSTLRTITSTDPSVIVTSAGAIFVAYLLFPPIWSVFSSTFRGYKGNLSAPQTLDLVSSQNYFLIDIRSEKEKSKAGVPRLPSNANSKLISIPVVELPSKLKGLVRSARKVEAEIVAIKISYLKRINKGSNFAIIDSYCDASKLVAKTLTSLGFKNTWVVADGFSGGRGWLQSRLGVDSYNVATVEVVSPSRVIPASAPRFGQSSAATRKLLPGAAEN